jgi:uncharacterized membrane protein
MNGLFIPLVFVAALGSALMAGTFFVFSIAVMRGLDRLPPGQAITSMQSINLAILNAVFLGIFVGTGIVCIILPVASLTDWSASRATWMFAGGLLYLFGALLVTIAMNVPLNNRLALVRADDPRADAIWRDYSAAWTLWNHIRALTSLFATAAFIMALR